MALNSDFKVKDSLYVGNSACFVTCTDTPRILSAGTELFDIFLQEGEISASCTLSNGTGIATLSYDGQADTTVSVDATCNTTWNSAYTTTQANSASWVNAATWCTTNGNNVIDTVAEGNAQGRIAVTDIGNTTSQIDVNGLQTDDSPTFGGLDLTGALTTSSTVDGRDVACDGVTLDTLQALSGDTSLTFSSPNQGTLRVTDADGDQTDVDLGTQAADNPSFAGVTADNIQIGVTAAGEIDTTSGNLTLDSAGGTVIIDDATTLCGAVTLGTGTVAGTSNTVLVSDGGVVKTDSIDSRVWGTTLVDGSGTSNKLALFSDADTVGDSVITQDVNGIQIAGGLSATGVLSGDGSGLTNITADQVTFPTTSKTDLVSTDQFYINDGADKQVTYGNLLTDLAGTGIVVEGTDSLTINGASALTNCTVPMWDSGSSCFVDTNITQSSAGNLSINGGLTVMDNLSVLGTFTCLDTNVSTTSALSVINTGTGPALYTEQTGASQPIAKFIDTEGGQIIFGDTGSVGIGTSTDTPSEKLEVVGNIAVTGTVDGLDLQVRDSALSVLQGLSAGNITGSSSPSQGTVRVTDQSGTNTDVDLGLQVGDSPTFVAASFTGLPTATDNTVVIMDGNNVSTDEIDAKVWGTDLVDGEGTTNAVPKYTNGTGTIGDSAITDSGTLVTIDSDTKIDSDHALQVYATGGSRYAEEKTFTSSVSNTATTVTTFTKTNLKSVKYEVTLVKGVNITAFEVHAVYNGTDACGTVYAIVDAQAASQLADVAITVGASTIDLEITAASTATTAVIHGVATY